MKLFEIEGFLRGKCLPGDMKVNETNAEYLVRKFTDLELKLADSQREFRATDETIENLQMQVEKLAAENAGLKAANVIALKILNDEETMVTSLWASSVHEVEVKTPDTDAFLAEVRASELDSLAGVAETMLVKFANQGVSDIPESKGWEMILRQASQRAAQLRKGAQS